MINKAIMRFKQFYFVCNRCHERKKKLATSHKVTGIYVSCQCAHCKCGQHYEFQDLVK